MTGRSNNIDLAAAKEHSISSRRTRAHVIICHDLDIRSRGLLDLFGLANRVSPELAQAAARELAQDIIVDCNALITELQSIKAFAERQITKLPTPLRE